MQNILVIITFALAAGYVIKKFFWLPVFEKKMGASKTLDGDNTKCGKKDCGCH